MRPIALSGYRELAKHFEEDPRGAMVNLRESLDDGSIKPDQFSLRLLFESVVEEGRAVLDLMDTRRKGGGMDLLEAAGAVDLGTFANITGQIAFSKIKEAYQNPNFLWPQLCSQQNTPFPYGERIPGVGPIGDKMEDVGEGDAYPRAGANEEYIDVPATGKRGLIVDVTREAVVFDLTGRVMKECTNLGNSFGLQLEKRVIDVAVGNVNNYKRNGVATNTYLTSGAYINSGTNALTDWTSIQTAELLFDAMTDPNTGEPIVLEAASLLVPSALKRTANRIITASEIGHVDNQANANTVRTFGGNPVQKGFYGQPQYGVLSNAFVKARTSSATAWFFGDFMKAITRFYNWDMEITQASDNNHLQFERDVWVRTKVSSRDVIAMTEPRYLTKN